MAAMMVSFINDHRDAYGVESICKEMPIAPSTSFETKARQADPDRRPLRLRRDAELRLAIGRVWKENFQVYGARKIWHQLVREDAGVARCTVECLRRQIGRKGVVRCHRTRTTIPDDAAHRPPDLVERCSKASRPNELWVADLTCVATWGRLRRRRVPHRPVHPGRRPLARSDEDSGFSWSCSPLESARVVNATLLGAEVLARAGRLDGDPGVFEEIRGTLAWSAARQQPEGGWAYGDARHHRWEDAFHTGFNLMSLAAIRRAAAELGLDPESVFPEPRFAAGLHHYRRHFFGHDGAAWYFRGRPYPLDAHAAAVGLLVLAESAEDYPGCAEDFRRVLNWSLNHLWNRRRRLFLFRRGRFLAIGIPYLRWSQAWMLLALARAVVFLEGRQN